MLDLQYILFFRVHVRQDDKIKDAAYHAVEDYMTRVDHYYDVLERKQTVDQRRVYVATDNRSLIAEAKKL